MMKWEYYTESKLNGRNLDTYLNEMGIEGWEVFNICQTCIMDVNTGNAQIFVHTISFKRPLQETQIPSGIAKAFSSQSMSFKTSPNLMDIPRGEI